MTYHSDGQSAISSRPFQDENDCFCCGKVVVGPTVHYDGYKENKGVSLYMHRDCAFAMAQRIICDAWPNRREGEPMKNNC
jgi:hypothetical protein